MSILRRFTNFVLQGRIQACATAFILAQIPVIGSAGILIPGLVTLRKGAFEGLIVFLAATFPYWLDYYREVNTSSSLEVSLALIAVIIVTASNAFMWLFALILRRYSSWGFIFDIAILLGVGMIAMLHLLYPDIRSAWIVQLTAFFDHSSKMMSELQPGVDVIPSAARASIVSALSQIATGIFFVSVMFNALLQLVISRWWQAIMFNPGELRKELLRIRLSYVAGILFLVCYALTSYKNASTMDMMPVLYLLFSLAGLSIVHSMLVKLCSIRWLVMMYIVMIVIMASLVNGVMWIALVLSIIAFLDIGFNFRKL